MKILSEEISTAPASYTRIIFNLCEIGLCFDKLPFEFSVKRKVLTLTEVSNKIIFFMRVKVCCFQVKTQMNVPHCHAKISRRD